MLYAQFNNTQKRIEIEKQKQSQKHKQNGEW